MQINSTFHESQEIKLIQTLPSKDKTTLSIFLKQVQNIVDLNDQDSKNELNQLLINIQKEKNPNPILDSYIKYLNNYASGDTFFKDLKTRISNTLYYLSLTDASD